MDFVDEYYADKDLSLLKKLTLVIPTYNRNYYLSRCLWYHAHFPFGQIIVADSSPEEKKVVNRETVAKVREMFGADILYLGYEPETDKYGRDIYLKWARAINCVNTPYSVLLTDKEFAFPKTFVYCLDFLEQHPDYLSADGQFIQIQAQNDDVINRFFYESPTDRTYNQDSYMERFEEFLRPKDGNVGSFNSLPTIRRSEFHKYIYNKIVEYNLNDIRFGDFIPQLLTLLGGKRAHFKDLPYKCRDLTNLVSKKGVNGSESSAHRYPFISTYISDGIYDGLVENTKLCVSDCLSYWFGFTSSDLSIIEYIVDEYISKTFLHKPGVCGLFLIKLNPKIYDRIYLFGKSMWLSGRFNKYFIYVPNFISISRRLRGRANILSPTNEMQKLYGLLVDVDSLKFDLDLPII